MSESLPVVNFKFSSSEEISNFEMGDILADSDTGYIIECDLHYPTKLHDEHSDYPLAPEHLTVSSDMLNEFCNQIKAPNWHTSQKLIPNLLI